jgi:hypothetical protein
LRLFDEPKGLRFELDLPDSPLGENMRSAISRGDIDGASFRFDVGTEAWDGDVRTVKTVKALHDVTLATFPAYPAASVELRTKPTVNEAPKMDEQTASSEGGTEAAIDEKPETEQRTTSTGTLRVTERDQAGTEARTLFDRFKAAGWSPKVGTATIPWREYETSAENRSLTYVLTLLEDGARKRLEQGGAGPGKIVPEDLVELEQHCREVGPQIGYPRSAEGAQILIVRWVAEIAHLARNN